MADGVEDEDDVVRKPPVVLKELVQDTATRGKGRVRPRKARAAAARRGLSGESARGVPARLLTARRARAGRRPR